MASGNDPAFDKDLIELDNYIARAKEVLVELKGPEREALEKKLKTYKEVDNDM